MVSTTSLRGRYAVRMCILNHTTSHEDVMRVLAWFESAQPSGAEDVRQDWADAEGIETESGWLAAPDTLHDALARTPLLRSLSGEQLARVASAVAERTAQPGDTIVEQWDSSRDFYLILDGKVQVRIEGEWVRDMGAGDFFGEIAALDWGAGFGYPRLGSVIATSHTWLAAMPSGILNELVRESPGVDRQIRRALRTRLYGS
jgi:hypothetical protein